eukprot:8262717-Prorocentrum_lima.AAC.1
MNDDDDDDGGGDDDDGGGDDTSTETHVTTGMEIHLTGNECFPPTLRECTAKPPSASFFV